MGYAGLLIVGLVVGFLAGWAVARHDITLYRHDGFRTVFHQDWPTYGLPMVEYTVILNLLEREETTQAKNRLNMFLDQAVQDAMDRYSIVSGRDRDQIRKGLIKVSEYRQAHPRPLTTNDAPSTVFWNRERQMKEDQFLSEIENSKDR